VDRQLGVGVSRECDGSSNRLARRCSVDSRGRRSCVLSIGKQDSPVHSRCRRCSIHGDMDRVRAAVSIDSGILSPQPSLPRTRVMVVRPGWTLGRLFSPFCSGERYRSPRWSERLRPEEVENNAGVSVLRSCRNSTLEGTNTEGEEDAGWVLVCASRKREASKIKAT